VSDCIGVFDSGVGGISVLHEIRRQLPGERFVYLADSAFAPYGDRSELWIEQRSLVVARWLQAQGAKAIVVACNTATTVAVRRLRAELTLPIVGIEPGLKPAVALSLTRKVAVLATTRTLASASFQRLQSRYSGDCTVFAQACPGLADRVEAGDTSGPETRALLERYVGPLIARGVDTLALGCTHYIFLLPVLREMFGAQVTLIDTSAAIARELSRRLPSASPATRGEKGTDMFFTTAELARMRPIIERLWPVQPSSVFEVDLL
jgi:glutamate racemase